MTAIAELERQASRNATRMMPKPKLRRILRERTSPGRRDSRYAAGDRAAWEAARVNRRVKPEVRRVMDAIIADPAKPWTVADMAGLAQYSKFHFSRLFTAAARISPWRFLTHERLRLAAHLLETTDCRVADVALMVGYTSVGTFGTIFRRFSGAAPTVYRWNTRRGAK